MQTQKDKEITAALRTSYVLLFMVQRLATICFKLQTSSTKSIYLLHLKKKTLLL